MIAHNNPLAGRFQSALDGPTDGAARFWDKTHYLVGQGDAMDARVDGALMGEALATRLVAHPLAEGSKVLFVDHLGGGGAAHRVDGVITQLGASQHGLYFLHVAAFTQARGVGALLHAALARTGAACGVVVDVVAAPKPWGALHRVAGAVESLCAEFDLIIEHAPLGSAGLVSAADPSVDMVKNAHVRVRSALDADGSVAAMGTLEQVMTRRPGFNHIRYIVEQQQNGQWVTVGNCLLGPKGDAGDRLWRLVDQARRAPWRILAEPVARQVAVGSPLLMPCRQLVDDGMGLGVAPTKVVQAGHYVLGAWY